MRLGVDARLRGVESGVWTPVRINPEGLTGLLGAVAAVIRRAEAATTAVFGEYLGILVGKGGSALVVLLERGVNTLRSRLLSPSDVGLALSLTTWVPAQNVMGFKKASTDRREEPHPKLDSGFGLWSPQLRSSRRNFVEKGKYKATDADDSRLRMFSDGGPDDRGPNTQLPLSIVSTYNMTIFVKTTEADSGCCTITSRRFPVTSIRRKLETRARAGIP